MANEKKIPTEIENLPKEAKITYTKSPDYKFVYANGIYGGLTGKGELRFEFFQEFHPHPDEEIVEITEGGGLGKSEVKSDLTRIELIREKQAGVVMSMNCAQAIYQWLGQKIEAYKTIQAMQGGEVNELGDDVC